MGPPPLHALRVVECAPRKPQNRDTSGDTWGTNLWNSWD